MQLEVGSECFERSVLCELTFVNDEATMIRVASTVTGGI